MHSSSSMHCKSILGLVDTHYDLVCRTEVFGTKLKFCQTILTLSAFVISFSMLSENKLKVHVHAVYRKTSYFAVIYFIVHTIELKSQKIGSQQSFFFNCHAFNSGGTTQGLLLRNLCTTPIVILTGNSWQQFKYKRMYSLRLAKTS